MLEPEEKKRIKDGLLIASAVCLIMLIVKLIEVNFDYNFSSAGIIPWKYEGLWGLIFSPFLHKDFLHLFNNIIPLFVSLLAIYYFYYEVFTLLFIIIWLLSGLATWLTATHGIHIGASGIVYGYLSFLFFVSVFSRNKNMLGIALVLIFLYGTMIWGIIPLRQEAFISWESHLGGTIIGFFIAILFRNKGLKEDKFEWEDEDENIDEMSDEEINELIDSKLKEENRFRLIKRK